MKAIAEGSFPELKIIIGGISCDCGSNGDMNKTCDLQTFVPQILINKGNQLTCIEMKCIHCISIDVVWKALKYCTAAKSIQFSHRVVESPLRVIAEDLEVICRLPNLQRFMFCIRQWQRENDACAMLRELIERVVKVHTNFQFDYKYEDFPEQTFSLYKKH